MEKVKSILKSELSFSLMICMMCFYTIVRRTSGFNIPAMHIAVIVLCLFSILFSIKKIKIKSYYIALFMYLLICIIANFKYIDSYQPVDYYFYEEYLYGLVLMMYFFRPIKEKEEYFKEKRVILNHVMIAYAIIMNLLVLMSQKDITGEYIGQRNILGAIDFISILCCVESFTNAKKMVFKIIYIPVILFSLYMFFYSGSRAPLFGTMVLFVLLVGYRLFKNKSIIRNIILVLSVTLVLGAIIYLFKDKILVYILRNNSLENLNTFDLLNTLTTNRWKIWTVHVPKAMKGDWLFGNGIDSLKLISFQKQVYLTCYVDPVTFCHNFIVDALFSSGIMGFTFFIIFWITFILYIKKGINKNNAILVIIFMSLMSYYLLDTYFIWERFIPNLYFMLLAKTLINEVADEKETHD